MSERIEKIRDAVQVIHRCNALHLESVPVREMLGGSVVWEGVVECFELKGHPKAKRCYGWTYVDSKGPQFVTVLELPPVTSPQTAVRASIIHQTKSGTGTS